MTNFPIAVILNLILLMLINRASAFKHKLLPCCVNGIRAASRTKALDLPVQRAFSPANDMLSLLRQFDVLPFPLSSSGSSLMPSLFGGQSPLMLMDVKETDKSFEISVDLPGVEKKDIKISSRNDQLTISADRSASKKEEGVNYTRMERYSGHMSRTVTLPEAADAEHIEAKSGDGVLHITIPKVESAKEAAKIIDIK